MYTFKQGDRVRLVSRQHTLLEALGVPLYAEGTVTRLVNFARNRKELVVEWDKQFHPLANVYSYPRRCFINLTRS